MRIRKGTKKLWSTDENKIKWMSFMEEAIKAKSIVGVRDALHVHSNEYIRKYVRGEKVPGMRIQKYIEDLAKELGKESMLDGVIYSTGGRLNEDRTKKKAVKAKRPPVEVATYERKLPTYREEVAGSRVSIASGYVQQGFQIVPSEVPVTHMVGKSVVAKEPKLTMKDMFELATIALPAREAGQLEAFAVLAEKLIAFSKRHGMSVRDVLAMLKEV